MDILVGGDIDALSARLDATPLDRTPTGLASLAAVPGLWRGDALARVELESLATGYAALDAQLPGGGWPLGALTEILSSQTGIGELRLFFPALARLTRADNASPIILLQPPYQPYAPAFAGAGIAPEQVLVEGPSKKNPAELAARTGNNRTVNFPGDGERAGGGVVRGELDHRVHQRDRRAAAARAHPRGAAEPRRRGD